MGFFSDFYGTGGAVVGGIFGGAGGSAGGMQAGGKLGGMIDGMTGQPVDDPNADNKALYQDAKTQNWNSMIENQDFQERMSNSAHQRAVADMRKAGINPILAAGDQASSPNGGISTASQPQMQDISNSRMATALEGARVMQQQQMNNKQLDAMDKNMKLTDSQSALTASQKNKTDMETKVISKGVPEADMKNKVYDYFRPWISKMIDGTENSADSKSWKPTGNPAQSDMSDPGVREYYKKLNKP